MIKNLIFIFITLVALPLSTYADQRMIPLQNSLGSKRTIEYIKLTPQQAASLVKRLRANKHRHNSLQQQGIVPFNLIAAPPSAISLGMNGVPVLDQGPHDTCVTFAVTAALDAALYKQGDYISQLCNLELGEYLHEQNPQQPSGWDGAKAESILSQIKMNGIITKQYQTNFGCADVYQYPINNDGYQGNAMSISEFNKHSDAAAKNINWTTLYPKKNAADITLSPIEYLAMIKVALSHGHRVLLGTIILPIGSVGATSTYKVKADTWAVTPLVQETVDILLDNVEKQLRLNPHAEVSLPLHEMIITGYDDNAVSYDENNIPHTGILTMRSSWGANVGDHGDFYMNYDYFYALSLSTIELIPPEDFHAP